MPRSGRDEPKTYYPKIEKGIPIPKSTRRPYEGKMENDTLLRLAFEMVVGDSVLIPQGTARKFRKIINLKGLDTETRVDEKEGFYRVWIIPLGPEV